ncbi:MAG: hypothetical protein GTO16_05085 [Candidatus Aminicenantes bacterium]|nr:hypothetical protein [Candidatus Aminicenantes bacterium]NIO18170.1 hypothetical protein [bacterium]
MLRRKVRGIPLIALLLVGVSIVLVSAQVITGVFNFNLTPPSPPSSGLVDDMITITEIKDFLQITLTITGTGEVGVEHTVDIVIQNVADNGEVLSSGKYGIGFEPQSDPEADENICTDVPFGPLNPTESYTNSYTWTPSLADEYRAFVGTYTLVWS